jgi:ABC-type branched-subunit amino acid transport system ATPase component
MLVGLGHAGLLLDEISMGLAPIISTSWWRPLRRGA